MTMTLTMIAAATATTSMYAMLLLASLPRTSLSFLLHYRPLIKSASVRCGVRSRRSRSSNSAATTVVAFPFPIHSLQRCPHYYSHRRPVLSLSSLIKLFMSTSENASQSSSSLSSSSSSSSSSDQNDILTSNIVGGDYAGLFATFSSKTGELISVPHHLIPASMLEWGDIPSCLESLTSEDWNVIVVNDDDESGIIGDNDDDICNEEQQPKQQQQLVRTMITVLPEVGCGIDNLEVTKTSATYSDRLECWKYDDHGHHSLEREVMVADQYRRTNRQHTILDVETIFQVDSDTMKDGKESNNNSEEDGIPKPRPHRIRISFSLDFTKLTNNGESSNDSCNFLLSDIITLRVERRYSSQSTQGTIWSGPSCNSGGLDARTVMNTIGKGIVYGDVFGVKRMGRRGAKGSRRQDPWVFPNRNNIMAKDEDGDMSILEGLWTKAEIYPRATSVDAWIKVHRTNQEFEPMESSTLVTVRLPQNVLLKCERCLPSSDNTSLWNIEVSHIESVTKANGTIHLQRRGVSRSFDLKKFDSQLGLKERLGNVSYWVERKILN